jgi:uncharacterized membrane protein YgcG
VPGPVPVAAPAMPFAAAGGASTPEIDQLDEGLACWYSIPAAPGQPQEAALLDAEPGAQFCAKWQVRCTMPSTACSQSDVSARAWRWVYGSVDQAGCDALKSSGAAATSSKPAHGVRDTVCCSGFGCNKPDSKLDAVTKIRTGIAAEVAVAPLAQQQQPQPAVLQPVTGSGSGMQQPVMIAAFGGAGHPGSAWISRLSSSSSNGGSWGGGGSRSSSLGAGGGGWGYGSSSSSSTKDGNVMGR